MFITVEGLDASGKSTFMKSLKERLEQEGEKVEIIGKRTISYDPNDYVGRCLLHLNHVLFEIIPGDDMTRIPDDAWVKMNASWFSIVSNNFFQENVIYLSDSWIYKRIARFMVLEKYSEAQLEEMFGSAKRADITFFMDVSPEETYKRREKHSRKDYGFLLTDYNLCTKERFLDFQQKIYNNLQQLSEKKSWIRLDGKKKAEEILEDAILALNLRCNGELGGAEI